MSTNSENSAIASTSGARNSNKKRKNTTNSHEETVVADTSRRSSGRRPSKRQMLNYTNDDDDDDDDDFDDDFGGDDDYEDDEDADLQEEFIRNTNETQIQNKNDDNFDNVVIKSEIMLDDYICPDISINSQTQPPRNNSADMTIDNNLETIEENYQIQTDTENISLKSLNQRLLKLERQNVIIKNKIMTLKIAVRENIMISKKILKYVNQLIGVDANNLRLEITSRLPISSLEEISDIEERLNDKNFIKSMYLYLYKLKGTSKNFHDIIKKVISDECISHFNWDGRLGKYPLENLKLIKYMLFNLYSEMGKINFEKRMKKYIDTTHNRYKQARYRKKQEEKN